MKQKVTCDVTNHLNKQNLIASIPNLYFHIYKWIKTIINRRSIIFLVKRRVNVIHRLI